VPNSSSPFSCFKEVLDRDAPAPVVPAVAVPDEAPVISAKALVSWLIETPDLIFITVSVGDRRFAVMSP
jgi:hypothetical protein